MRNIIRQRLEVIQIVLSLIIALIAAYNMIGQPARTVDILALTAGMFGTGGALGVLMERRRTDRLKISDQEKSGQETMHTNQG
jgi:hypothetical protein